MSAVWKEKEIEVSKLLLDPDNPRFYHLKHLTGRSSLRDKDLQQEIEKNDDFLGLVEQIKYDGVRDPIWVVEHDSKYLVIEGNMRTTCLRKLLEEKAKPPNGVRYDKVKAHVFPSNTPPLQLAIQRTILQGGKKPWLPFNNAANIYKLRTEYRMQPEEIAQKLNTSPYKVNDAIENFKYYVEFTQTTGVVDHDKFSYFSYAPTAVRERFFKRPEDRKTFYRLIAPDPKTGLARIRSYGSRGGLKEFAKIIERPDILNKFLRNSRMTVLEAYEELMDSDIKLTLPFLKKLPPVASGLRNLNSEQLNQIKKDTRIMTQIKSIYRSVAKILSRQ